MTEYPYLRKNARRVSQNISIFLPCFLIGFLYFVALGFHTRVLAAQTPVNQRTKNVEHFVLLLQHTDPYTRRQAVTMLTRMGTEARAAVPALVKALEDPNVEVRERVIEALGKISKENGRAVPALVEAATKNPPVLQKKIFAALGEISTQATAAVPALVGYLENEKVGAEAARALGRIGAGAVDAIPPLIAAMALNHDDLHGASAAALGDIAARAAKRENWDVKMESQVVEALAQALLDAKAATANQAAQALAKLGPAAAPAVPNLIKGLSSEGDDRIRSFAQALAAIGPSAAEAVPALQAILSHRDLDIRGAASYAINEITKR